MQVSKRCGREKKVRSQHFCGWFLGRIYDSEPQKKWCRKSPRLVLREASHLTMLALRSRRRRTIQRRKSDARDENGLASTRVLGDHHASAVSVVPVSCPNATVHPLNPAQFSGKSDIQIGPIPHIGDVFEVEMRATGG